MRVVTYAAAALILAIGVWAFVLGDAYAGATGMGSATVGAESGLAPYPGADSIVARRVLDQADGLYTPSPDGTKIVFSDRNGDVAIRHLRSGEIETITDDGRLMEGESFAYGFEFSPDQGQVAYVWVGPAGEASLRVVTLDTREVREILPEHESRVWANLGSWSPDGSEIAAVLYQRDGARRIVLIPAAGGDPVPLRSFDWRSPDRVAFSPDGRWLAYDLPREQGSPIRDIHLVARDASREVALLEGPVNQRVVGWMPAGGPFFYLSGDAARATLTAAEFSNGRLTGAPQVVRADMRDPWPKGFGGDAFFYVQMPERRQAYTAPWNPGSERIAGPLSPLDPGRAMDWPLNMAWSPEGDRVAYVARAEGEESSLVIRSLVTASERVRRVPFNEQFTRIEWSPTEDRIVVWGTDNRQRSGIHLVELSSGETEFFLRSEQDGPTYTHPRWAPDGSSLYVLRGGPAGSSAVVRVGLESGDEEELYRDAGLLGLAVAPDEDRIAVGRTDESARELHVLSIRLGDGAVRELARVASPDGRMGSNNADLDWTPDGRHLAFGDRWRRLWVVNRDGAELRQAAETVGTRPRIHPHGHEIALIAGENRWEIWALENLAPGRLVGSSGAEAGDLPSPPR